MYNRCDTLSLQILFVHFLALPSLLHPSSFNLFNCFLYLLLQWRQVITLFSMFINNYLLIIHVALSQLMQDKFGDTALIIASQHGHIKCATVLLNHQANVNYRRKVRLL